MILSHENWRKEVFALVYRMCHWRRKCAVAKTPVYRVGAPPVDAAGAAEKNDRPESPSFDFFDTIRLTRRGGRHIKISPFTGAGRRQRTDHPPCRRRQTASSRIRHLARWDRRFLNDIITISKKYFLDIEKKLIEYYRDNT
jgi:hypothetical protein